MYWGLFRWEYAGSTGYISTVFVCEGGRELILSQETFTLSVVLSITFTLKNYGSDPIKPILNCSSSPMISSILGLFWGSWCKHLRIRARSLRFFTMATCSSRLSGFGSFPMLISHRRTPKLYTSTWRRKNKRPYYNRHHSFISITAWSIHQLNMQYLTSLYSHDTFEARTPRR